MANNPKATDNLRPFSKGVSGNPKGRPRSLSKAIKTIPENAQKEIYGVLYHAISLGNKTEARKYLEKANEDAKIGRYGFILQLAIKALMGSNGWSALNDIMDRLFGKARQSTDITATFDNEEPPIIVFRTPEENGKL